MGRSQVDDHRFLLYQGGAVRDITEVVSSPELRDELDALSVEVSFTALRNKRNDPYAHWYNIAPGDKLRIVNGGAESSWRWGRTAASGPTTRAGT